MTITKESVKKSANKNKKALATLSSVVLGFLVSSVVLMIMGYDPFFIFGRLLDGSFGTTEHIWQTLQTWTVYVLLGLSVAIGFKAGLFNIGTAGQMLFGALMGYAVAYHSNIEGGGAVILIFLVVVVSAAVYACIAGAMKALFGVNEVVTSIMLNWIAVKLGKSLLLSGFLPVNNMTIATLPENMNTTMDSISPRISWIFFIAIALIAIIFAVLRYTKFGLKLKVTGNNPFASTYSGYKTKSIIITSFAISGLIAGIAAMAFYFGSVGTDVSQLQRSHFEAPASIGFTGITIALIALNNPIGIAFSAIFFASIQGEAALLGLDGTGLPEDVGMLFGSIIIYFVAAINIFIYIITPSKIKQRYLMIMSFFKDEFLLVWTKIWVTALNILTIGIYSYVSNNYNWGKKISYKEKGNMFENVRMFLGGKEYSTLTKTWVTTVNILTLCAYSFAINHYTWAKPISYKKEVAYV